MNVESACYRSPLGGLIVTGSRDAILSIQFSEKAEHPGTGNPVISDCIAQLHAYFQGKLREFDVPLSPTGTFFDRKVWCALLRIPYGTTVSYAEIAQDIGNPRAARSVGNANHRNPWAIVVPCHRVIRADGSFGGYGAGIHRKIQLIRHEKAVAAGMHTNPGNSASDQQKSKIDIAIVTTFSHRTTNPKPNTQN